MLRQAVSRYASSVLRGSVKPSGCNFAKRLFSTALRPTLRSRPTRAIVCSKRHNSTPVTTDGAHIPKEVADLTLSQYHEAADETLESMLLDLEDALDNNDCGDLDVECNTGILTISLSPNGDYVINKQPPNKQLWLSSPISGPNRYDLIHGEWVSLRDDGKLLELLSQEISEGLGFKFEFEVPQL